MDLPTFYEGEGLQRATALANTFSQLGGTQTYRGLVGSPLVIKDRVARQWVGFNYHNGLAFDHNQKPVFVQFDGVLRKNPEDGATCLTFIGAMLYLKVDTAEEVEGRDIGPDADDPVINSLIEQVGVFPTYRGEITEIGGGMHHMFCDFMGRAAPQSMEDLVDCNSEFALCALRGATIPNKALPNAQWMLQVPYQRDIIDRMRGTRPLTTERLERVRAESDRLLPANQLAGMSITYEEGSIALHPIVTETHKEKHERYLSINEKNSQPIDVGHVAILEDDEPLYVTKEEYIP